MSEDLEWIRLGLKQKGKTQRGLAEALKVDPAAISRLLKGRRELRASEIKIIADYLEKAPMLQERRLEMSARRFEPSLGSPEKLPVYGLAEESDGCNAWSGEIVDYVPRLPSLVGVAGAYACYVTSASMEPRFFRGELLYVHPGRPVNPGHFILLLRRLKNGDAVAACVRRLIKVAPQKVTVEQYNPHDEKLIATSEIKSMHAILALGTERGL